MKKVIVLNRTCESAVFKGENVTIGFAPAEDFEGTASVYYGNMKPVCKRCGTKFKNAKLTFDSCTDLQPGKKVVSGTFKISADVKHGRATVTLSGDFE